MIAIDSSTLIAFFEGHGGKDIELTSVLFADRAAIFPPLVITEILSNPWLSESNKELILEAPQLDIKKGYFERAGLTRAKLLRRGLKARTADTLIAQCCIDSNVSLLTRDNDFRHFAKFAQLKLLRL